jgi:hypothetical protein
MPVADGATYRDQEIVTCLQRRYVDSDARTVCYHSSIKIVVARSCVCRLLGHICALSKDFLHRTHDLYHSLN